MSVDTGTSALIQNTAHVGFTVADLHATIALFEDVFGYSLTSCGSRNPIGVAKLTGLASADITVAHLEREGMIGIELIAYTAPAERALTIGRPCDTGFVHLSYEVTDAEPILARAERHGLLPLGELVGRRALAHRPGTGQRVVYLGDGRGINIELIERS
jgi:catechol 2,3-dioxygenase-like lactoylglutathione lyase family enzyme